MDQHEIYININNQYVAEAIETVRRTTKESLYVQVPWYDWIKNKALLSKL